MNTTTDTSDSETGWDDLCDAIAAVAALKPSGISVSALALHLGHPKDRVLAATKVVARIGGIRRRLLDNGVLVLPGKLPLAHGDALPASYRRTRDIPQDALEDAIFRDTTPWMTPRQVCDHLDLGHGWVTNRMPGADKLAALRRAGHDRKEAADAEQARQARLDREARDRRGLEAADGLIRGRWSGHQRDLARLAVQGAAVSFGYGHKAWFATSATVSAKGIDALFPKLVKRFEIIRGDLRTGPLTLTGLQARKASLKALDHLVSAGEVIMDLWPDRAPEFRLLATGASAAPGMQAMLTEVKRRKFVPTVPMTLEDIIETMDVIGSVALEAVTRGFAWDCQSGVLLLTRRIEDGALTASAPRWGVPVGHVPVDPRVPEDGH